MRRWIKRNALPFLALAWFGVARPVWIMSGCEFTGSGAIGSGGSCGYADPGLDSTAVALFDWVALSSMMFGIPILIYWAAIFIGARILQWLAVRIYRRLRKTT